MFTCNFWYTWFSLFVCFCLDCLVGFFIIILSVLWEIGWFPTNFELGCWNAMTTCKFMQLNIFLQHECYWINHMNCNRHNSLYVKPYMYTIHATHLQLCRNTMQLVYKYRWNVMLMLFFIHPSMMNYVDFQCNYECNGNTLMAITN